MNAEKLGRKFSIAKYQKAPELWVITTYFNSHGFKRRRINYEIFCEFLRQSGVPTLTIECAFGDQNFELPEKIDVVRVRSDSLMWQKERLLNIAASLLPQSVKYVAYLDCDIVFLNPMWATQTAKLLEKYPILQTWETCVRLNENFDYGENPDKVSSFGSIAPKNLSLLKKGRYDVHGHTGYGWAMQKEVFDRVGLYEGAISGSADHFMAHAIFGEYGFCVEHALKHDHLQFQHLKDWGEEFYKLVRGNLSATPGEILHLWHGDLKHRRYFARMHEITDLGFNPYTDITSEHGLPLKWNPEMNKPGLIKYFEEYFKGRREDG